MLLEFLAQISMAFKEKLQFSLKAKKREVKGKKNQAQRKNGLIPAVLYGQKTENLNIAIDSREFGKVFEQAGENTLIDLQVEGKKESSPVLIYDLQKDPLSGDFLHIDFYQPDLEKEVTALVPIKIVGQSYAVKSKGGTLIKNANELEVRALPLNLPHELIVNVDSMKEFGDEIFIKDIELSEGVKILKDANDVLITVSAPTDVDHELEKEIEEKVEEVETISKAKEGEEEGEEIETKEEVRAGSEEPKKQEKSVQKKK